METSPEQTKKARRRSLAKILGLLSFILVAVFLFTMTPIKDFLSRENLDPILKASGLWAPLIFILIHAASICLFFPASILTVLGAAIFGTCWGFIYVWIGCITGASGAFFIGRFFGRDFIESRISDKLSVYDDAIRRNGFTTVLYLRLLNLPFTPLNFGMGLTKVHFRDYFLGTGLGMVVGIFVLTFFGGALKDVWASGNWDELISYKFFLSVSLFIISFLIPITIKKIKGEPWIVRGC